MRKKPRFHSLKKLKVRQDWSRWTLYALQNLRPPNLASRTYFQQKWTAKSDTRAYHGEQIREKQWKRLFRRNLPAVVPMDHTYLARYDGSEQAAGRGAGVDTEEAQRTPARTPYMQMTYYPIERRLDSVVFRALFASSVRQARQFVVHGLVKVNGKKMVYPGYMLNPGDLFQVDPESVMYATGAPKKTTNASRRIARKLAEERKAAREEQEERTAAKAPKPAPKAPLLGETSKAVEAPERAPPSPKEIKESLQSLMEEAKAALEEDVKAKDKQKLRDFRRSVRKAISLWRDSDSETVTTLSGQLAFLKSRFASANSGKKEEANDAEAEFTSEQQEKLEDAFARLKLEAEDDGGKRNHEKPYKTPWEPRDYMAAFAFIPRYLEVNQNVCAAVYLRHPVARPGLCEVPTPFTYETGQLAFNWYLRRR